MMNIISLQSSCLPVTRLSGRFFLKHEAFARLLPKEIFREPFGLPKIKVGSPSHNFRSPELIIDY